MTTPSARVLAFGSVGLLGLLAACSHAPTQVPRVRFNSEEVKKYTAAEQEKAAQFSPTEEEKAILEAFEKFQTDEGAGYPAVVEEDVRYREKQVSDALYRLHIHSGLDRLLALGDYLADRCSAAIMGSSPPEEVSKRCGSLVYHATESGLIDKQGRLHGPPHLVRVLFKVRWRSLVPGLDPLQGLNRLEQLAFHDFIVAFASPGNVQRKLESIAAIQKLDPSYPAKEAEAFVRSKVSK